ncbi:hypothetical protein [Nonomuraea sp. NPDC049309]|uniref:hypothetical protein n=1 Tax=Nonomuraea sp. NPDC049309 TaxID=3364350 RepID=UPI00371E7C5A
MTLWRIVFLSLLSLLPSTSLPPAQATPPGKRVLVELRKEGGFAGLRDRVTVHADGCARFDRRSGRAASACLTAGELRRLRTHLRALRLGAPEPKPQGFDFITYTLAYEGRRVSRYTLTPTWRPVVTDLERALEKYGKPR